MEVLPNPRYYGLTMVPVRFLTATRTSHFGVVRRPMIHRPHVYPNLMEYCTVLFCPRTRVDVGNRASHFALPLLADSDEVRESPPLRWGRGKFRLRRLGSCDWS